MSTVFSKPELLNFFFEKNRSRVFQRLNSNLKAQIRQNSTVATTWKYKLLARNTCAVYQKRRKKFAQQIQISINCKEYSNVFTQSSNIFGISSIFNIFVGLVIKISMRLRRTNRTAHRKNNRIKHKIFNEWIPHGLMGYKFDAQKPHFWTCETCRN